MANMFKLNNLNSVKWTVQAQLTQYGFIKAQSPNFRIQGQEYYLRLHSDGDNIAESSSKVYLTFFPVIKIPKGKGFDITVLVTLNSRILPSEKHSLTDWSKEVWTHAKSDVLDSLLTFEVIVHVDLSKEDKTIQTVSYLTNDISMKSLSEDFCNFLDTGLYHDVEVKCGEHTAKAHKIVLSARSEVFKAMLETDMKESQTGILQIQDVDVNYFQDFIRYLYTALIPELTFEKAKSLYEVGDKYAVRSLMHQCSEYLQENLSAENAFECLVLADAHSDQKLECGIITYIIDKKLYLQDEYWAPFCDSFPKVAIKVYKLSHEKIEGHCEKKMKVF